MVELKKWIDDFKLNNAITKGDNLRDSQILDYLEIAYNTISEIYCGQLKDKDGNFSQFWVDLSNKDKRIKMASIHLATVFFNNPDNLQLTQGSVQNDRTIYRLLGSLTVYY